MKSLVVLGGADGAISTVQAARRLGLRTICVDQRGDAPAVAHADEFLNVSSRDVDRLARALRARGDVVGVVSPASDVNLPTQAALAVRLGLPSGLSDDALRASVDKGFFRAVCDQVGLPGPRFTQGAADEVLPAALDLDLPVIVKPTDSSGGRGVCVCTDPSELPEAIEAALVHSRAGIVIVEEYLEGHHFTAEALVQDGSIAVFALGHRVLTPRPGFVTLEHRMPTDASLTATVRDQLDQVCAHLGYRWGPLNADVVVTSRSVALIEMGARLGGNGSAEMLGYVHGLDIVAASIQMAVGAVPRLQETASSHAVFRAIGAGEAGKLVALHGIEQARALPGVEEVVVAALPGEYVEPYLSAGSKVGYVVAVAETASQADAAVVEAQRLLEIEVATDVGQLDQTWPDGSA